MPRADATAGLTIRPASADDLQAILTLQQAETPSVNWSEALWRTMLREADDRASHRSVWLAESPEGLAGFALLGGATETCELEMVLVAAAQRGRGIGRALCRAALLQAAGDGATRIQLEVRASNRAALRLYASLGFLRQGLRRGYYRRPPEDAVLLGADLRAPAPAQAKV